MAKRKNLDESTREDVIETIMVAIGLVLGSKTGGKVDPARDRECAINVLDSLEEDGFSVVKDA